MRQFTLDLRRAGNLNPSLLTFRPVTAVPRQPLTVTAKNALTGALALGKSLDPRLSLMSDVTTLGSTPGATTVLRPAGTPSFALSSSTQLTMAVGFAGAGFALFGPVASIGAYASTTREIGGYLTLGIGLFIPGVGASLGACTPARRRSAMAWKTTATVRPTSPMASSRLAPARFCIRAP